MDILPQPQSNLQVELADNSARRRRFHRVHHLHRHLDRHSHHPQEGQHHHSSFAPLHRYHPPQNLEPLPATSLQRSSPLTRVKAIRAHRANVLSHANRATTIQRALPQPCMDHHAAGPAHPPEPETSSRYLRVVMASASTVPRVPIDGAAAMVSPPQQVTTAVSNLTAQPVTAQSQPQPQSRAIPSSAVMPNASSPSGRPPATEPTATTTHVRFDSAVDPDVHGNPLPNTVSHFSAASATARDNAAALKSAARHEYHEAKDGLTTATRRQHIASSGETLHDREEPAKDGLIPVRQSIATAKHAVAAASLQLDHVKEKTRQSIYEFALSRIDTLEDEQFSWPHLRQNLERLFGSIQPLPDFAFFVYDVLMWTQPLKTAFVLGVYLVALFTGRLMLTVGVVVGITLVYYGVTQERVLAGMGLRCLYLDAQRQPAFADKSHTQHIERRTNESSLATLANPDTSPLYVGNLPSVVGKALTGGDDSAANKTKGAKETWAEIKDKVLPVLQLQTRDAADLAEKVYNMITWRRPQATVMAIVQSGMLVLVLHCVPSMVLHRMIGLLIALNIFILVPLQLKFPRYRRMFSVNHVLMWPFPTHAEWAIEQLAKATQPQVAMIQYPTDPSSSANPTRTATSSSANQEPATTAPTGERTTTTTARVDHFPCTHNGRSGTLVIRSGGRDLEFISQSSLSSRARRNVLSVPMSDIVRIRKSMDRALWVMKNYQLEVNLRSGQVFVFEHVQRRDEAFGLLAAASSDPKRLWRVPGT